MEQNLLNAFRYHRRELPGSYGRHTATVALRLARVDLASIPPRLRYPASPSPAVSWQPGKSGHAFIDNPANAGLRIVGRVMPEPSGRNGIWDDDESGRYGWHCDPWGDGDSLISGVVFQLAGRGGKARFVAGYLEHDSDCYMVDFSTLTDWRESDYGLSARDIAEAAEIWREADHMAQRAAESEIEYQRAWQSGQRYSETVDEIASIRRELKSLLTERKAARPASEFPSLCAAIKRDICRQIDALGKARESRDSWLAGDGSAGDIYMGFNRYDPDMRAAFCDGASLPEFPA